MSSCPQLRHTFVRRWHQSPRCSRQDRQTVSCKYATLLDQYAVTLGRPRSPSLARVGQALAAPRLGSPTNSATAPSQVRPQSFFRPHAVTNTAAALSSTGNLDAGRALRTVAVDSSIDSHHGRIVRQKLRYGFTCIARPRSQLASILRLANVRGSPAVASGSRGRQCGRSSAATLLSDPDGELCERRLLRKASGSNADARRNPIGKGNLFGHVTSRRGVDLPNARKVIRWKSTRRPDERWPQPPMDKRDLSFDETANEHIVAVANRSRHRENLVTFRVSPPASPHGLPGDGLSNRRNRPLRSFKHDTVLPNESESLA
jgi:hypothetical protein